MYSTSSLFFNTPQTPYSILQHYSQSSLPLFNSPWGRVPFSPALSVSFSDFLSTSSRHSTASNPLLQKSFRHECNPLRSHFADHTGNTNVISTDSFSVSNKSQFESTENITDDVMNVEVIKLNVNSRRVIARVKIEAPISLIFNTLCDYQHLSDFIPSLCVNEVIETKEKGAILLQVAEQEIAFGFKFKAQAIVEVSEIEADHYSNTGNKYGEAKTKDQIVNDDTCHSREIAFNMLKGDFDLFKGTWNMKKIFGNKPNKNSHLSLLTYTVDITPKKWLPVAIIEGRMAQEIQANLYGVRNEVIKRCNVSDNAI